MKISVVTPYYNNFDQVSRCVDSVLLQDYDDFEVILVDDGSTDTGHGFAPNDSRIVSIRNPINLGPAAARNLAVARAGGDLIVFLDSDSVVDDPQWLRRHAEAHRLAGDGVIIGGGIEGFGRGVVAKADAYCHWFTNIPRREAWQGEGTRVGFIQPSKLVANNISFRPDTFDRIGPPDKALRTGENGDFCSRAVPPRIPIKLLPAIVLRHQDQHYLPP